MLHIDVVTLFPGMISGATGESIVARAVDKELLKLGLYNPRDYCTDKHRACDDTPYGGGGGMVMKPEPLARCLDDAINQSQDAGRGKPRVLFMCPQGRPFTQNWARELAGIDSADDGAVERSEGVENNDQGNAESDAGSGGIILVCGRYEGIDERVYDLYCDERLSIGDFVLSGGEPAAIIVIDALARLLPGVLGCNVSAHNDSFSPGNEGLLDAPHYTRPEVFRGRPVPPVLLSGDHAAIEKWRANQSHERTQRWRPDLLSEDN